ncbi:monocarboxylate transporter 10-like protein, partial [Dinothrombium tinctorium]
MFGGLISSLGCLFASFASQFHQVFISYALFFGFGVGLCREASDIMLGQYFKRKRAFVEIFVQSGIGLGVCTMSFIFHECIKKYKWRATFQIFAVILTITFAIGILQRSASLYHPQRRAIVHLKNQSKKFRPKVTAKQKKVTLLDFFHLRTKKLIIVTTAITICSFGYFSPLFYTAEICEKDNDENKTLSFSAEKTSFDLSNTVFQVNLILGMSFSIGVILNGFITINIENKCQSGQKYLSQATMIASGISSIVLSSKFCSAITIEYFFMLSFYGFSLGSLYYNLKILLFRQIRARYFNRIWSLTQWTQSLPILIGIMVNGYLRTNHFSSYLKLLLPFTCILAALILFLVSADNIHKKSCENHFKSSKRSSCFSNGILKESNLNDEFGNNQCEKFTTNMKSESPKTIERCLNTQCSQCGQDFVIFVNTTNLFECEEEENDILEEKNAELRPKEDECASENYLISFSKLQRRDLREIETIYSEEDAICDCECFEIEEENTANEVSVAPNSL